MKKPVTLIICFLVALAVIIPAVLFFSGFIPVSQRTVPLAVTFQLTDPDYTPLPDVPIRLVFCSDKNWQAPDAGQRFVTDAKGEGHVTVQTVIDRRWRKMPTNFIASLISPPQLTDHLTVGAEMEYMNYHWLYVVDIILFSDGTSMQDHFSVYTRDEQGRFSLRAEESNDGWKIKDLGGMMLTRPGYDTWDHSLGHDPSDQNWTLKLAFKKFPPPIRY